MWLLPCKVVNSTSVAAERQQQGQMRMVSRFRWLLPAAASLGLIVGRVHGMEDALSGVCVTSNVLLRVLSTWAASPPAQETPSQLTCCQSTVVPNHVNLDKSLLLYGVHLQDARKLWTASPVTSCFSWTARLPRPVSGLSRLLLRLCCTGRGIACTSNALYTRF
jgi:hypothetical protein